VKRVDPVRTIVGLGANSCAMVGEHDWYRNPITGASQPVPPHREINDHLARHIIQRLGKPCQ
jgi:hypothetical protein